MEIVVLITFPPFLGEFDPWVGETASDNRYVTISGERYPGRYVHRSLTG